MFKPRPYQRFAEDSVFDLWNEGKLKILGRCYTGGGKTVIFANIIKRINKRALVIAHREELIWQARNKIESVTGLKFQVEMGDYRANGNFEQDLFNPYNDGEAGVVATVQTLTTGGDGGGRISKFLPEDFGLLIIDEAHRAIASSYRRVMSYFLRNPNLVILGVTATPNRTDEEALGQVFDEVAFDFDMSYGVNEGWLVPIEAQQINVEEMDFNGIKTVAGDLSQGELSRVMEAEKPLLGMADAIINIAGERRGIGFSPSVEHARKMANIFNRYRPGCAAHIHGKTDKDERRKINADFSAGKIQWIWNCGTHTEGFDDAGVEIIVPKPTKSGLLLEQMIGRGTRPHDSIAHQLGNISSSAMRRMMIGRSPKPSCLILEFYGNRYDLASSFDILGGNVSGEAVRAAIAMARKTGAKMQVKKAVEDQEKLIEERRKKELEEASRKSHITVKAKFNAKSFDPFTTLGIHAATPRGWDAKRQVSEKMRNMLAKAEIDVDQLDYAKAKQLCGVLIGRWNKKLCSLKQVNTLKKFNIDATNFTFSQANQAFDWLKNNHWSKAGTFKPNSQKLKLPPRT